MKKWLEKHIRIIQMLGDFFESFMGSVVIMCAYVMMCVFLKSIDRRYMLWFVVASVVVFIIYYIVERIVSYVNGKRVRDVDFDKKISRILLEQAFLEQYNVPEIAEVAEKIVMVEEVEKNYYEHRGSTVNASKWGVYVGKFFVSCNCTANTFKCVELLRGAGIEVAEDKRCIYEKGMDE